MLKAVAQIAKTYGAAGEVLIKVLSDTFDTLENESVFLYFEGMPVPFFIQEKRRRASNAWVVRFTTVRDSSHAAELAGREVYVEESPSAISTSCDYSGLEDFSVLQGFTLLDQNGRTLGEITAVEEYPGNVCLAVGSVLVPFHDDLVLGLSAARKTLTLNLPEGLF